jgi:hypothetical protein
MQADRFQPISYIIIAAGPPAELYHSWSSSWRVKVGNRIAGDVYAIMHTEESNDRLLQHFNNGWMIVGHNGRPIIDSKKILFENESKLPASQEQ